MDITVQIEFYKLIANRPLTQKSSQKSVSVIKSSQCQAHLNKSPIIKLLQLNVFIGDQTSYFLLNDLYPNYAFCTP